MKVGVPYKGKWCPIKCYNSKKPRQWFIKLWLLTCAKTSYCWNFKIYEGKGETWDGETKPWVKKFGAAERVVLGLTKPLAQYAIKTFGDFVCFVVTCDRYFSSPLLCRALDFLRGMRLNGTIMMNRKHMPKENFRLTKGDTNRGFYKYKATVQEDIVACIWRDRNIVAFISSAYSPTKSTTNRVTGTQLVWLYTLRLDIC